jgi:ferredoxin
MAPAWMLTSLGCSRPRTRLERSGSQTPAVTAVHTPQGLLAADHPAGEARGLHRCANRVEGNRHGSDRSREPCELPARAGAFPIIKDLVVDRSAFDRIITAGGFFSANTGSAPEANAILVPKDDADSAMDAAAIGCGACVVAACPNASASLFTAAKITHLGLLPQGQPERARRVLAMVACMDEEGFGNCTWHGECQAACPTSISIDTIAFMNGDWLRASLTRKRAHREPGDAT